MKTSEKLRFLTFSGGIVGKLVDGEFIGELFRDLLVSKIAKQ